MFCVAYGVQAGLFNFFIICLNEMSSHIVNSKDIGWVGFTGNIGSIVGILGFAVIVDKYRCYKKVMFLLFFLQIICWIVFSFVILYCKTKVLLFLAYILLCIFNTPFVGIGLSCSAELTYPISEGLSSAICFMFGNGLGFLVIIAMGNLIDNNHLFLTCAIVTGLYVIGFIQCFFIKEDLKRSSMESNQLSDAYISYYAENT